MTTEDSNNVNPAENESENLINKNQGNVHDGRSKADQHERESTHLDQNPFVNGRRLMNPDQEKRAGSGGSESK